MKLAIINHLLGENVPQTNEEYRKYLKREFSIFIWVVAAGVLLSVFGFAGEFWFQMPVDDYLLGLYFGAGIGLILAGIIRLIRNKRLRGDEEKLKQARLEMSDERIQTISSRAFRMAAWVMLIAMYLGVMIGGIFYPVLPKIMCCMICLFCVSYSICYYIFEKRM